MTLVEKLEKRAKELDRAVGDQLARRAYYKQAADDRDLLEQAARHIRRLEATWVVPSGLHYSENCKLRDFGYVQSNG